MYIFIPWNVILGTGGIIQFGRALELSPSQQLETNMTSRRGFLRVVGTSAVILAAGGVGLTQCDPMPEEAVAAWKGP
ncbi:MAG: twin-arginine translocation signal domain-containing protein, partial [Alphaproteobacteria bacterium]|nr:twin-arginine translocation signal domain-containing protein [Alphaproteobacteria bacterium]